MPKARVFFIFLSFYLFICWQIAKKIRYLFLPPVGLSVRDYIGL